MDTPTAPTDIIDVCVPPASANERPLGLAIARDAVIAGATVSVGLGLASWAGGFGSAIVSALAAVVGFVAGFVMSNLLHEWGHYAGAMLTGAYAPRTPINVIFPLFNFDIERSTERQFMAMSLGGNVAMWIVASAFLIGLDGSNAGELGLQAGALASALGSILGLEGYIMVNALRHGRLKAWHRYLPNRAKWVRASFVIGAVGAAFWLIAV